MEIVFQVPSIGLELGEVVDDRVEVGHYEC